LHGRFLVRLITLTPANGHAPKAEIISLLHEVQSNDPAKEISTELSVAAKGKPSPRGKALSAATFVGLTIALLLPMPPYREPFLSPIMKVWGLSWIAAWESIGLISKTVVIIAIPLLVVYWERRSLKSIGLRAVSTRDLLAATSIFLAYLLISPLLISVAYRISTLAAQLTAGGVMYASLKPKWLDWSGLLANGIAEEVGFRGYAIERIEELTGSTLLGASVPFIINVLVHAPVWGLYGMLAKAPILLLLVVLYLWRRNLPACALAHTRQLARHRPLITRRFGRRHPDW
jgi:membrane protease YdiL (CAAX protease family)